MEVQTDPIAALRQDYIRAENAKDPNPTDSVVADLRQQYIEADDAKSLRGQVEKKRAEKKKGWGNFVAKVKRFGDFVVDVAVTGIAIGDMVLEKDSKQQLIDTTKDKGREIVDLVSDKASEIWEQTKTDLTNEGRRLGRQFSEDVEAAADDIHRGVGAIERRAAKMGKGLINSVGRDVLAPITRAVVTDPLRVVDSFHGEIVNLGADFMDVVSGGVEKGANIALTIFENPEVKFIRQGAELGKKSNEKRSKLQRMFQTVGGWIDSARSTSVDCILDAQQMRMDARNVRSGYLRSEFHRDTTNAINSAAQTERDFKRGIL